MVQITMLEATIIMDDLTKRKQELMQAGMVGTPEYIYVNKELSRVTMAINNASLQTMVDYEMEPPPAGIVHLQK